MENGARDGGARDGRTKERDQRGGGGLQAIRICTLVLFQLPATPTPTTPTTTAPTPATTTTPATTPAPPTTTTVAETQRWKHDFQFVVPPTLRACPSFANTAASVVYPGHKRGWHHRRRQWVAATPG